MTITSRVIFLSHSILFAPRFLTTLNVHGFPCMVACVNRLVYDKR